MFKFALKKSLILIGALTVVGLSVGQGSAAEQPKPQTSQNPVLAELLNSGFMARFGFTDNQTAELDGTIDAYLAVALRENQLLHSIYSDYLATHESISEVTSLPDPTVKYSEYLQPVETRVGPQLRALSVTQSFPWFGSLSLRGDVRSEIAKAARARFFDATLNIISKVKNACFDIGFLERSITITQQHVSLLTQWEDVARVRYSAGSGQYTDVIKAQVELGLLSDRLNELLARRRPLAAVLNALLNRDPESPIDLEEMPAIAESLPPLEILTTQLKRHNPLLTALEHKAQESLKTNLLINKQGQPSFSLGLNYIQTGQANNTGLDDSGKDAVMASLALTVPIWRNKYSAASKSAVNQYQSMVFAKQDLGNELKVALEKAHYLYLDAHRKMELYQTALLPKGHQSLGATRSSYEAGNSSFLDLVDAQRLLLEFELSLVRARFDVLVQESIIEKLVANPISKPYQSEE